MPLQFCPISFTLFPSIKRGGKTYSILMHIRENSDTSSGGIDHSQSPLPSYVPMTSIIRPRSCWLMHSRQVVQSSAPTPSPPSPSPTTPFHHLWAVLSPFSVLSLLLYHLYTLPPPPFPPCSLPSPLVLLCFLPWFIPSCNQITVTPCWC